MAVPLLVATRHWHCPQCGGTDVTNEAQPHTRFHPCPSLGGLTTPMAAGMRGARVVLNEREDYIGKEDVTMVAGRPITSITTEYPDGHTDVAVYAPTARMRGAA